MCSVGGVSVKKKNTLLMRGVKAVRVHIPIQPGRNGLIRYMKRGAAVPKPKKLFQSDALTLLIVEEGTCTYLVDERRIECRKGSMLWGFPDQQRTLYERSPDLSLWVIEFDLDFLHEVCTEENDHILQERHPDGVFYRLMPSSELRCILPVLVRLVNQELECGNDYYNAGLQFILMHCWQVFMSSGEPEDYQSVHPAIAKVIHQIRDDGDVESSVSTLADKSGLCPSRLIPLFQEQIGMSITDFRNRVKLEQFFDLYQRGGQLNMLGAALEAGFGSYAQFYRVFCKAMHKSPRDYFSDPGVPG